MCEKLPVVSQKKLNKAFKGKPGWQSPVITIGNTVAVISAESSIPVSPSRAIPPPQSVAA